MRYITAAGFTLFRQRSRQGSRRTRISSISKRTIMLRDYLSERGDVSLTEADILTEIYWAGYEQFVLFINAEGDSFDCKVVTETVGGVEFVYPTTQTLLFYGVYNEENGSLFNTLGWAFEKGYLTHDDLLGISGNYVSGTTVSVA